MCLNGFCPDFRFFWFTLLLHLVPQTKVSSIFRVVASFFLWAQYDDQLGFPEVSPLELWPEKLIFFSQDIFQSDLVFKLAQQVGESNLFSNWLPFITLLFSLDTSVGKIWYTLTILLVVTSMINFLDIMSSTLVTSDSYIISWILCKFCPSTVPLLFSYVVS